LSAGSEGLKNFSVYFFSFDSHLPLEKGVLLNLNKFRSTSPKMICAKSGKNQPCGSGEVKNVNVNRQTDGRRETRKAHSSGEPKTITAVRKEYIIET
jgi:hypothetical protein